MRKTRRARTRYHLARRVATAQQKMYLAGALSQPWITANVRRSRRNSHNRCPIFHLRHYSNCGAPDRVSIRCLLARETNRSSSARHGYGTLAPTTRLAEVPGFARKGPFPIAPDRIRGTITSLTISGTVAPRTLDRDASDTAMGFAAGVMAHCRLSARCSSGISVRSRRIPRMSSRTTRTGPLLQPPRSSVTRRRRMRRRRRRQIVSLLPTRRSE